MTSSYIRRNFTGHLGRLNQSQQEALDKFKAGLEKAGLYIPATGTTEASHDDATLLRFLRARRFDPAKAQKQFSERIEWEKKWDIDRLFANFPTEEFEDSRRYYPRWTGRRDQQGLPIYVYPLSALSNNIQAEINAVDSKRRYERIAVLYEAMIRLVSPLCTYLPHAIEPVPIASVTTVIDLKGVTLKQMWSLRSHLQEASELANQNYPETLGTTIVVNAPSFFSTVWGWIKGWFDENTRDKINVFGDVSDPTSEGGKMIRELVAKENLPKEYGGELEWSFFDPPMLDEETRAVIGELPRGPWIFKNGKVIRPKEYEGDDKTHASQEKVQAQSNEVPNGLQADSKIQADSTMRPIAATVG